jgi:hypothetical protein
MTRISATVIATFFGLTTALVACSSVDKPADPCADNPKAKGCKKTTTADPATSASTYQTPPATSPPTPPAAPQDAGPDARPHKPDGGSANVPPANTACLDLVRCCARVQDTIERAACLAIGYNASASTCANSIIAYQVFGGCGHDPFSMPDIFNSDGSQNTSKDCTYLEQACVNDPTQCDAAYQCNGATLGSDTSTSDECTYASDPYCCRYPDDYYCNGSSGVDACDNSNDPYCCRHPDDQQYCSQYTP